MEATERADVAALADTVAEHLTGDDECYENPEKYFDQVIHIDLSTLEPHVNGPYTPDLAWPISELKKGAEDKGFPMEIEVGLIGSCTNSSYEDLTRAASLAQQAKDKKLKVKSEFTVTPGSEQIRFTVERDGILDTFEDIGGVVIGQCLWAMYRSMGKTYQRPEKEEYHHHVF